jgi:hypothetical protein
MAEREDLELQRRTAPKGGEKCGQKSGQEVSEGESKEKGQLPVYQSDRILRERQWKRMRKRPRLASTHTLACEADLRQDWREAADRASPYAFEEYGTHLRSFRFPG